jgi:hypothetical protein
MTNSNLQPEKLIEEAIQRSPYFKRIRENIGRVNVLVTTYQSIYQNPPTGLEDDRVRIAMDDILRAAVIFTHATLEDFLRTMASILLPEANKDALEKVRLKGSNADKFTLSELIQYKGKLVDEVIRESVEEYLERSTFSRIDDIIDLMRRLGFKESEYKNQALFAALGNMIKRRHQIVHRADRPDISGLVEQPAQAIAAHEVLEWIEATQQFIMNVLDIIFDHYDFAMFRDKFGI